jgi:hypothetical protein
MPKEGKREREVKKLHSIFLCSLLCQRKEREREIEREVKKKLHV